MPPTRPASRSAAGASTRPSPPRSWKPSPRPASPRPPARSASCKTSTTSGSPASASRVERAEFEADRARRQFDACEPEHRLVARTLERALEDALAAVERERGKLAALEQARPAPLTDDERAALARLARDLPRLWNAPTTTDRDRKELLRTLVRDVDRHRRMPPSERADVEICWEGGARTELTVRLNARGPERRRLPEDTVELIRRLAAHHPDHQIAAILSRNGHRTGTGLAFTAAPRPLRAPTRRHPRRPATRPGLASW